MLPKFRLRTKLLASFIIIASFSLLVVNYLWFESSRKEIIHTTSASVASAASDMANQIQSYFDTKTIGMIVHAQTEAVLNGDIAKTTNELESYLNQDKYIEDLSLLDKSGKEVVHISRNKIYAKSELRNQSQSPEFKIPNFVGGERYISQITFDKQGVPHIFISLPVVQPDTAQEFRQLTTSSIGRLRQTGEIRGVLVARYNLQKLWDQIGLFKIGQHGYVFLVDDKGIVLSYPQKKFILGKHQLTKVPEVNKFIASLTDNNVNVSNSVHESFNEFNQPVLINSTHVPATNWGVIAQIPLSDTLAATYQAGLFAIIVFLIILTAVIILILGIAQQIVKPIEQLREGSSFIGSGKLDYRLAITSGDEIEDLGNAFNSMASKLQTAFQALQQDTKIITAEHQKFETAVANIADAIIAVDFQRNVIIFNKAAELLFGISSADALSKPIKNIITLYDNQQNIEITPAVYCPISNDPSLNVTWRHTNIKCITTTGKNVFITVSATQIPQGNQVNIGCLLAFHDLTAEKSLEEMKLDFVSMAAHELRTPLTSLKGYLSVFMKETETQHTDEERMFLDRVNISAERLTTLIENLLSVTKIERGVLTTQMEPVDWVPLVIQLIADLTNRAKEKKISIKFIPSSRVTPPIKADRVRIIEVLSNLIENAINYTPEDGTITVWLETNDKEVITHVQDTGIGIAPEATVHLFTKFFRVTGHLTQGTKGTGLGLYISKSIVDKHNGRIWVESTIGKGSTFSFALPIANTMSSENKTTN
jgi:PAS domain S-box-containing protein